MFLEAAPETSEAGSRRITIRGVTPNTLSVVLDHLPPAAAGYVRACGFKGEESQFILVPDGAGDVACVLWGVVAPESPDRDPFAPGRLLDRLPAGDYRLAEGFDRPDLALLALYLAAYRFSKFRQRTPIEARFEIPDGVDGARIQRIGEAICFGRELIDRPANDLGPAALQEAIVALAGTYGAEVQTIVGEDLLTANFPLIHAVGRAASEAPRLVDLGWGKETAPKVTLVGKGVCFDTGGLDIKPSSAMLLMKKDMGGAATALALAKLIMSHGLNLRLRVLVPIVENSIAGDAFRPGDILRSRKGLTVEIGNTDAEGRLILADALTLADDEAPDLLLDFATLTGAARVALGPDLPPFYTRSEALAADIARHASAAHDPLWRLPLWGPYKSMLKSKVADLNNAPSSSFAGSITAALFLQHFVSQSREWAHFDVYGWTPSGKPGRPEGGEVQAAHALFCLIEERYGAGS
jgi:leucyl aminopeptidase